ncbi:YciI family protein [Nocardiopsis ansamitocini]|uniref:YCII-related domain-containing protein n=1 Tax=Nocardiopsis ansamitocini TaxID=1670832 RepID=A0A9W6UKU0_9ACTN|nr:YciI family protein [Nocardiopsis ansamitocini]GLU50344.1 hypothetical protein Nans01_46950 [Nocardiopsis ansamitocini]
MRYLLLIPTDAAHWATLTQAQRDQRLTEHVDFTRSIIASGEHVDSAVLSVPADSRTVRVRDGRTEIIEGPRSTDEEQLGGYYLVDCADDERAAEVASQVPDARFTSVEIRRLKTITGLMT